MDLRDPKTIDECDKDQAVVWGRGGGSRTRGSGQNIWPQDSQIKST
jgi:hypothetical protein